MTGTVNINSTYVVEYDKDILNGKFHFNMEKIKCPYPWLQDYTWNLISNCDGNSLNVNMDNFGNISVNNIGCFTLIGNYNINQRFNVIIHFIIKNEN